MSDDATSLCLACGFCCDGTLFTAVPLAEGDDTDLPTCTRGNGSRYLKQPCSALSGTRCTAYEKRPLACRRYQCLLLIALQEKETTLSHALEVVSQAKDRLQKLAEPPPGEARMHHARERQQQQTLSDAASRDFSEAEAFLKFHFVGHRR